MDINVVCLFPDEFYARIKSNHLLGRLFKDANEDYYKTKICHMLTYLLSMNSDIESDKDVLQAIHIHHQHMRLTRAHYIEFINIFKDTLIHLCGNHNDIYAILHKLVLFCKQLYAYKYVDHFDLLETLQELVATAQRPSPT